MMSTATQSVASDASLVRGGRDLRKPPELVEVASSDYALVREVLSGNQAAFDTLVLRHRKRVIALVWRFFPDPSDAEDMAQDAFVRAYTNLEKLKKEVPFQNWLIRIAANLCLDRLRREKRRPRQVGPDMQEKEEEWLDRQVHLQGGSQGPRFENTLIAQQLVSSVLDHIAPRDRLVLHLLYAEGRSVEEVAKTMGWTKSNVKVRAFRARRSLRGLLKGIGVTDSE